MPLTHNPLLGPVAWCIHVTPITSIDSILSNGLEPRIGPLSQQMENALRIYMFPSWEDLENAHWLFDEGWPYEEEPALLAINTQGIALNYDTGFEVSYQEVIETSRIHVLAPNELHWDSAKALFLSYGGNERSFDRRVISYASNSMSGP